MSIHHKLAAVTAALTLGAAPAVALASGPGASQSAPGHSKTTSSTASPSTNAKRYGKLCQGESKQHVKGQKGTPFSDCVTDMAQLAANKKANPHRVCANESKQHVAGTKGTPYSQCVVAAAKLRGTKTGSAS